MKLPKREEKFVVIKKNHSLLAGSVVSGLHVEIWPDYNNPDAVFYYMCIDTVYGSDYISRYGTSIYCRDSLDGLMECFSQYFFPYQERKEKADEKAAVGEAAETSEAEGTCGAAGLPGDPSGDPDAEGGVLLCSPGGSVHAGMFPGGAPVSSAAADSVGDCLHEDLTACLNHIFDSFNSLAAGLLHMQHVLAPVPSKAGGAAYA